VTTPERSSRIVAATTIVAVHVVAFYALTLVGPRIHQKVFDEPVQVHFVAESRPAPKWTPPEVRAVTTPQISTPLPEVPVIDIPVFSESQHAISMPVRSTAAQAPVEDRSTPKLISTVEYLREPAPRYPPQSRKLKEQGLVVLRVLIDETGTASLIEVQTSSGHERLDRAAREAVSRAEFRPYVEDGFPRRALVLIPIEFSLNRGSA
jgi:protein TonB